MFSTRFIFCEPLVPEFDPFVCSSLPKCVHQEVIPDFFADEYYEKVRAAFKRVDGMALSNLLSGRVFNALFCEVFAEELGDRSEQLVEDVKDYMQETLGALCDRVCAAHPVLLNELKVNLVEEFFEEQEAKAKSAVNIIIEAEQSWVFTQDRSYEDTMKRVNDMVNDVRKSKVQHDITYGTDKQSALELAKAVGQVPEWFMWKKIDCAAMSEEDAIRDLQVGLVPLEKNTLHALLYGVSSDRSVVFLVDADNHKVVSRVSSIGDGSHKYCR